jgi:hypothetical protein
VHRRLVCCFHEFFLCFEVHHEPGGGQLLRGLGLKHVFALQERLFEQLSHLLSTALSQVGREWSSTLRLTSRAVASHPTGLHGNSRFSFLGSDLARVTVCQSLAFLFDWTPYRFQTSSHACLAPSYRCAYSQKWKSSKCARTSRICLPVLFMNTVIDSCRRYTPSLQLQSLPEGDSAVPGNCL